jgi:hypothetical protein
LVREFLEHYHTERPHQAKENDLLTVSEQKKRRATRSKKSEPEAPKLAEIACQERLGGLLMHYSRKAA